MNADGDEYGWAVTVGLWRIKHKYTPFLMAAHKCLWQKTNQCNTSLHSKNAARNQGGLNNGDYDCFPRFWMAIRL
jgi:hypothetical protein